MMKKWLAMALVLLTLSCSAALAENEIVLPNGLQFGMPLAEATAISGFQKGYRSPMHDAKMDASGFDSDYLVGDVVVGGHNASMEIYFTQVYLRQIRYSFVRVAGELSNLPDEKVRDSWDSVAAALEEKYENTERTSHQYKNSSITYFFETGEGKKRAGDFGFFPSGYIVKVDGGSVYIENDWVSHFDRADTRLNDPFENEFWEHCLTYTFYDFQIDSTTERTNSVGF